MSLKSLLREKCLKRGSFELSSGEFSDVYVDVKSGYADPELLSLIAAEAEGKVEGEDAVAGTALGGVPIATALSLRADLPLLIVRKEAKDHGTAERVEGPLGEGKRALVVEDVTTTGGSLLSAVEALREAGASVERAVVVVDRGEGAVDRLSVEGVELVSLATLDELLEDNG